MHQHVGWGEVRRPLIRGRGLLAALAGCGMLLTGAPLAAQTAKPGPGHEQVARLIRDLGATEYGVRQTADDRLARLGPAIRQDLETALRSDDAEVRLRAQQLLTRVKIAELWTASPVGPISGQKLSQAFERVARQSGNHVLLGDHPAPADQLLSFALPAADYWQAVDELCRRTGNHVRPNFDTQSAGLVVAAGAPGQYPTAYAGPLRVQIVSARRVFSEDLDYENLKSDVTHSFQFNLQMMWEDRLRLVAYAAQPEVSEAVPDQGKPLGAAQHTSPSWNVATGSTRQVSASVRIVPPSAASKSLATLKLRWGLVAVGDLATVDIKPVRPRQRWQQDDLLVTIDSVEQQSAGRCDVCLLIARELALPEPAEILLEENSVALIDQHGKPFRLLSQSNSLVDQGVQMKLSFGGDSAESTPEAVQLTYPRLRTRRDAEIVFRNVPLPAGRLE